MVFFASFAAILLLSTVIVPGVNSQCDCINRERVCGMGCDPDADPFDPNCSASTTCYCGPVDENLKDAPHCSWRRCCSRCDCKYQQVTCTEEGRCECGHPAFPERITQCDWDACGCDVAGEDDTCTEVEACTWGSRPWRPGRPCRASTSTAGWTRRSRHVKEMIEECFPALFTMDGATRDDDRCPGSDHCRGNAIDVYPGGWRSEPAEGQNKSNGDDLVAWLVENHTPLQIKYIIWYGQQWYPSGSRAAGWRERVGDQDHYNHIHISVN